MKTLKEIVENNQRSQEIVSTIAKHKVSNPVNWVQTNILTGTDVLQEVFKLHFLEIDRQLRRKELAQRETESLTELKKELRTKRDLLLQESDYTQLADAPIISSEKKIWRDYRSYLRKKINNVEFGLDKDYRLHTFDDWKELYGK